MAIELGSSEDSVFSSGNIFFTFSLLVLVAAVGIYAFLNFVAIPQSEAEIKKFNNSLSEQSSVEQTMLKNELFAIEQKVADYKLLLYNRPKTSVFFNRFESWIHPQVSFSTIALDAATRKITLRGVTNNFQPIVQQIFILNRAGIKEFIESYEFSNVKLATEGGVEFDLSLIVKPEVFK